LASFEFSYAVDEKDFARAMRTFILRRPQSLIIIIGSSLLAGLTLCLILAAIIFAPTDDGVVTSGGATLYLVICMGASLFLPAYLLLLAPYLAKRRIKKHKDMFGFTAWIMDEEHLTIVSPKSRNEVEWSVFKKVIETKTYYFVVYTMNKNVSQFIPKAAFESPDQEARFREYIERHVGPIK
jgi:hypothetical protein